ncbi:hypothetical protein LG198_02875 [Methylobacillus arboreus]|uniref:hypothetical protein n=1 Tax=Methylobacillus arboreus TaxID=755170 RepID=UPI001E611648|nr:hypothetical protein [Methylobacillus arboreus]MCB5189676.1 hypothetical protein [Methylobacillus arboreus]
MIARLVNARCHSLAMYGFGGLYPFDPTQTLSPEFIDALAILSSKISKALYFRHTCLIAPKITSIRFSPQTNQTLSNFIENFKEFGLHTDWDKTFKSKVSHLQLKKLSKKFRFHLNLSMYAELTQTTGFSDLVAFLEIKLDF